MGAYSDDGYGVGGQARGPYGASYGDDYSQDYSQGGTDNYTM